MKTFIALFALATVIFVKPAAHAADAVQTPSSALELVLNCDVSFDTATDVKMELVYRNIGVTNYLDPIVLEASQTIIWDGKKYRWGKSGSGFEFMYVGPSKLYPLQGMTVGFHLSDYAIPSAALTSGRHSVAVNVALSESNILTTDTLTIFIGKQYRAVEK